LEWGATGVKERSESYLREKRPEDFPEGNGGNKKLLDILPFYGGFTFFTFFFIIFWRGRRYFIFSPLATSKEMVNQSRYQVESLIIQ
jgi:hypothetical protein